MGSGAKAPAASAVGMKVVQDNAGSFFQITGDLSDVAWLGVEVKRVKGGGWEPKKKARVCAVRKACTTEVAS